MKIAASAVLVLFAALVGWFTSEYRNAVHDRELRAQVASRILNYSEEGAFSQIQNPYSYNQVLETEGDVNEDGKPDEWLVVVRPSTGAELAYLLQDLNSDERPDAFTLSTKDVPIAYQSRDTDGDGKADVQQVTLPGQDSEKNSEAGHNVYFDINMDGTIDIWKTGHKFDTGMFESAYLIVDTTVVRVLTERGGDYATGFWITYPAGEVSRVVFNRVDGVWDDVGSE